MPHLPTEFQANIIVKNKISTPTDVVSAVYVWNCQRSIYINFQKFLMCLTLMTVVLDCCLRQLYERQQRDFSTLQLSCERSKYLRDGRQKSDAGQTEWVTVSCYIVRIVFCQIKAVVRSQIFWGPCADILWWTPNDIFPQPAESGLIRSKSARHEYAHMQTAETIGR